MKHYEEKIESNFDDIYGLILEKTGLNLFEDICYKESKCESIAESLDWINQFVHDEEFRENAYTMMIERNNVNELMVWMQNNIHHGWRSSEDNKIHDIDNPEYFSKYYRLQSPTQLAESKVGLCWDQCELERRWFGKHGIEHGVFYIEIQGKDYAPSHTFLAYHMHDSYWWFENSWSDMRGIKRYDDLRSLIIDVVLKHQVVCNDNTSPVYVSWLKDEPTFGINMNSYIEYAHSQKQLDVNNLPNSFYESYIREEVTEETQPPELPNEDEISDEESKSIEDESIEQESEDDNDPPSLEEIPDEVKPTTDQPVEQEESKPEEVVEEPEEIPQEEPPKKESYPKQTDRAESDRNGIRRKKLYIAFIEWCKEYNPKNTFGSIFDKDIFHVTYPFVPEEMRYFYRLANPMLCVLAGDLTFFPVVELRKINSNNSKLDEMMIFAATPNDLRVFNKKDKKVYRATEENGEVKLAEVLNDTFDTYIQKMIDKGDILNGPINESMEIPNLW